MSCKKQFKGTKMTLAQFATLDTPKVKIPMKKFPVMEQLDERAPVVSMIEIMNEEKKNAQILTESDNSSDSDSQKPQVVVSKKKGKPNFKKGTKLDLDYDFHRRVPLETEYDQAGDSYHDFLKTMNETTNENLKNSEQERIMKAELNALKEDVWQKKIVEENFKSGVPGQFSLDFYHQMIEARQRSIDNAKFTSFGEMNFMLHQIPNMARNLMMSQILNFGIKVVSEISKKELTNQGKNHLGWDCILNEKNAFFRLSKNGKEVQCDVRQTFYSPVHQEVQIVQSSAPYKFDGSLHLVDMIKAAEYINKMLS